MKKQLALVNKDQPVEVVNKAVQPKPTKSEMVEALARVRLSEITKENEVIQKKRDKAKEAAEKKLLQFFKSNWKTLKPDIKLGSLYGQNLSYTRIEFQLESILTKEVRDEIVSYFSLPKCISTDFEKIKKEVRQAIADSTGMNARVDALISDKNTRSALSKILVDIGISEIPETKKLN